MVVSGTQLAEELSSQLTERVRALSHTPSLAILSIAPDFATLKYLDIKKKRGDAIGISLEVVSLESSVETEEVLAKMETLLHTHDGVVLQLPFPPHIDTKRVLDALPRHKDPDCIGREAGELPYSDMAVLPPVVAAIVHIAHTHRVSFEGSQIVLLGRGRLVGAPMERYLTEHHITPTVITQSDQNGTTAIKDADIIISGAGVPGLITPDQIKEGVVIFDAGTSEEGGKLRGDADPSCAQKAGLLTPVPGGIGPLAVVKLFENLIVLADRGESGEF